MSMMEKMARFIESKAVFNGMIGDTLGRISAGSMITLSCNPEKETLVISDKVNNKITLPYERIVGFKVEDETTLAKSNSGIGRAIVGGLLFGGAGAIVGCMSGKGKTNTAWYGTLTYIDKSGNRQNIVIKESNTKKKSSQAETFENCIAGIVGRYTDAEI